jgi:hypothetical protein
LAAPLVGCTAMADADGDLARFTATRPPGPTIIEQSPEIASQLMCIRDSGALRGKVFVVGPWVDATGKYNAVAAGATGSFLPQAGSANAVVSALHDAGATVVTGYFGAPAKPIHADYVLNGIFTSLDFGTNAAADVQVSGLGPNIEFGWADVSLSLQMDDADTRLNRQISKVRQTLRYSMIGATVGKTWGGTLVTGGAAISDQQRLQFEAIHKPIAFAVVDVLSKQFPGAAWCRVGVTHSNSRVSQQQQSTEQMK